MYHVCSYFHVRLPVRCAGARPEVPSEANHSTSLLLAAKRGSNGIATALIEYCNPSNLADLIETPESDTGMTPLMYAAQNGDPIMVRLLLRTARSAGMNCDKLVSATSTFGINSLMFACCAVPTLGLIGEDAGLFEFSEEDSAAADNEPALLGDSVDVMEDKVSHYQTAIRMERIPSLKTVFSDSGGEATPTSVLRDAEKQERAAKWRAAALGGIRRAERVRGKSLLLIAVVVAAVSVSASVVVAVVVACRSHCL